MKNFTYRKYPRLKDFSYCGRYRYFLTICTFQRKPLFKKEEIVNEVLLCLRKEANKTFFVWSYCFMPDHLHLLVEGINDQSNLKFFVKNFKQKSGYNCQKNFHERLWQKGYYERVLRKEEATEKVALYIWNNPVRKGIVNDYKEYPFSGSFVLDKI